TLSLTGVHVALYDEKRNLYGMGLLVHSLQAITGEPGGGTAYYRQPVVSVRDLDKFENGSTAHVQLVTDEFALGSAIVGHDDTGSLRARTSQQVPVKIGTIADLVGYVARTNGTVILEDAYFQRIGFGNKRT